MNRTFACVRHNLVTEIARDRGGTTLTRECRFVVESIDELIYALASEGVATAVIDIEPMIALWGCPDEVYAAGVAGFLERVRAGAPTVRQIFLVSNSPLTRPPLSNLDPPTTITFRSHKPWRTGSLVGAPRPMVVAGDQPLTDGLLAWRLRCTFLHWRHRNGTPWWPRLQQQLGRAVTALLFVTKPLRTET